MREFAGRALGYQTDSEWARERVDLFPRTWQARLLGSWRGERGGGGRQAANLLLLQRVRTLSDSARGGIRPDAGDADICQQAQVTARDFVRRLQHIAATVRAVYQQAGAVSAVQALFAQDLLQQRGLGDMWPVSKTINRAGALARMCCERFWRRVYRKLHARTVEACAIGMGLVHRNAGIYASDDRVRGRMAQNARNAAVLESVTAVNDLGQDFTLAELAAKGTANKSIRRVELLTRIAGFELIAKDMGHVGFMVTMTCPSRFHKCTTLGNGRVVDNPKYDGSTPDEAQKYLSGQWAKCRAAAARRGVGWYGFRIAEPQHDGTPHWHCLLFIPAVDLQVLGRQELLGMLVRKYFLDNESPHEPGAQKHRVDIEAIDWRKGSAVGYVIKYISKNIDGHGVGLDLFGNDAITSSQRVEAWASTWRIRQFQQIGGAPVGVWRELRRVNPDNLDAVKQGPLRDALAAVNIAKIEPGVQALAWKKYTTLQGGYACKRKALAVRIVRDEPTGECGRYGEVMPGKPLGVVSHGVEFFRNHIHEMNPQASPFQRRAVFEVESERSEWVIGQGPKEVAIAAAVRLFQRAAPRIHVNNCTRPDYSRVSEFAPVVRRLPKLRRYAARPPSPGRSPGYFEEKS